MHGEDGLDEVTLSGATRVIEIRGSETQSFTWQPSDFGLETAGKETMLVDGPEQSAAIIRRILAGEPGPPRDVVILNAAAALWIAGTAPTPRDCAQLAGQALDSDAAQQLLARLAAMSQQL